LSYSKDHEWVKVEGTTGTIGITDHAQKELGDLVFIELPEVGTEVTKDGELAVVESVKASSPVLSPVSVKITEINEELEDAPETVNTEPYGAGWLVKVELKDPSQLEVLMDTKAYLAFLGE
jgi:glycine cleavage system H protein